MCPACETSCPYRTKVSLNGYPVPFLRPSCLCETTENEQSDRAAEGARRAAEVTRRARTILRNRTDSGITGPLWQRTFDAFDPTRDEDGQRPAFEVLQGWAERFEAGATIRGWTLESEGYGVGKSHLALAAGIRILERGYSVRFLSLSKWLSSQYAEFRAGGKAVGRAMDEATSCDLLIIDDLGVERVAEGERGDWVRQQIFTLFDERVNAARPLLVTTNLDRRGIAERIGGDMGGRVASRLSQLTATLTMSGPDSRPHAE